MNGRDDGRKRILRVQGALLLSLGIVVAAAIAATPAPRDLPRSGRPAPPPAVTPAPTPSPEAEAGDPPRSRAAPAGSERDLVDIMTALGRSDPPALERMVGRCVLPGAPKAETVAALRVSAARGEFAPFALLLARENLPEELLHFALKVLSARAAEAAARTVLADFVRRPGPDWGYRATALVAVVRWGDEAEVAPLMTCAEQDRDPENREAILAALSCNPHEDVRGISSRLRLQDWAATAAPSDGD